MDSRKFDRAETLAVAETPEDVAILYAWANLHGAKYRDFSASRREYRAQIRHRAAETLRERELQAAAEAESAAAAADRAAREAEAAAQYQGADSQMQRLQALRNAEAAARRAAAERVEAARRAEAAAVAEATARREEREIAEAHASAQRQEISYAESEIRRRQAAGPQPRGPLAGELLPGQVPPSQILPGQIVPGQTSDPYVVSTAAGVAAGERQFRPSDAMQSGRYRSARGSDDSGTVRLNLTQPSSGMIAPRRTQGYRPDDASALWQVETRSGRVVKSQPDETLSGLTEDIRLSENFDRTPLTQGELEASAPTFSTDTVLDPGPDRRSSPPVPAAPQPNPAGPAWLYAPQATPPRRPTPPSAQYGSSTLQDSRERVASRWFALKGVFEQPGPGLPALQPLSPGEARTPLLGVFSLAGGVGKTSLVATLGRALSAKGEKVLLTDTTSHGLLPFYFGARELRPGVIRTFSPPSGSTDAPIYLVSYDIGEGVGSGEHQNEVLEEILRNSRGNQRVVLDLSQNSNWILSRLASLHPTILVPVAPDMNSVISLQSVERYFRAITDSEGRPLQPYYVLNQFDAALPLHLDVREVFRRQLGPRLLPFVIRRSPAVSEALAEGMTVIDYAPDNPVSQDYLEVATWLRSISGPATSASRNVRWSER